jgi:hypothetical protein
MMTLGWSNYLTWLMDILCQLVVIVATETPPVKNVMAISNIAINNACLHLCGITMTHFSN